MMLIGDKYKKIETINSRIPVNIILKNRNLSTKSYILLRLGWLRYLLEKTPAQRAGVELKVT
jgi:hypothetical protein